MGTTDASPNGRRVWSRVGVVAAVGVAGFAVTAAVRSGENDESTTPISAPISTTAATVAAVSDASATPLVVEVPMRILAPIELPGLPADDESYEGVDLQTSVVDILSPVVGEVLVPSGGGSTADSWSPAPPEFATQLGMTVPDADLEMADVRDQQDVLDVVEILGDALDDVVRRAADQAAADTAGTADTAAPLLGDPVFEPDGELGFIDPCADTESDACPDPGEPATVITTFALQVPPPLSVIVTANPLGECAAVVADDELRVEIESTTPLEELTLRHLLARPPHRRGEVVVVTPDATRDTWLEAFGAAVEEPPPPIKHCLTLTGITTRDAVGYLYQVDARDVFDQRFRIGQPPSDPPYFSTALGIPQTRIWPLTDNEVFVSAAHRVDQDIRIWAFKRIVGSAETASDPCPSAEPRRAGYEPAWMPLEMTHSTTDPTGMVAAGLDPAYNHRTGGAMRLDEGSTYRLCVYWSVSQPTFAAGIERTEGYDLATPDGLETSFTVVDVDIEGTDSAGLDPGELTVHILPKSRALVAGFPECGSWRNRLPINASATIDELICDVNPRSTALYERGAIVDIRATDVDGVRHTSRHVIRTLSCTGLCVPPESQLFRVELPSGAPERDFWCGGIGDACDRPSDESYGTVLIRVDYANDNGTFNAGWSVSEPTEIGDERPDPPETPQLDTLQTPRSTGFGRAQTVTVPIVADREVTFEAELLTADGAVPCVNDGGNTIASGDLFSTGHTVTFEGLCPGPPLFVVITLTDREGNSSVWHGAPGEAGFPAGSQLWRRGFIVLRPIKWRFETDLEFSVPTPQYRILGLGASLSGSEATGLVFWTPHNANTSTTRCERARGPISTSAIAHGYSTDEVRFTIVLDIELLASDTGNDCRAPSADFEQPDPLVLRLDLPFEAVVVGDSYVLAGSIPIEGLSDPAASIDLTGTITIVSQT